MYQAQLRTLHSTSAAVQPAFRLGKSAPPPSSLVFAEQHRPRARPAANARVTLIVQRVIGNLVLGNKAPDLLLGPVCQRAHLNQAELPVPSDHRRLGAVGALIAPD